MPGRTSALEELMSSPPSEGTAFAPGVAQTIFKTNPPTFFKVGGFTWNERKTDSLRLVYFTSRAPSAQLTTQAAIGVRNLLWPDL